MGQTVVLFTTFLADLPVHLKRSAAGIKLFGLLILCLMFMDDITILLQSAAAVVSTLDALAPMGKGGVLHSIRPRHRVPRLRFSVLTPLMRRTHGSLEMR